MDTNDLTPREMTPDEAVQNTKSTVRSWHPKCATCRYNVEDEDYPTCTYDDHDFVISRPETHGCLGHTDFDKEGKET